MCGRLILADMLSYSKGRAVIVFLKWMLCFIALNQVVALIFAVFAAARLLCAGEALTLQALMGAMTSPWVAAIGNTSAWLVFMFWEMKSVRVPWRAALVWRAKPVLLFVPVLLIGLGMIILINELDVRFQELLPMSDSFKRLMGDMGDVSKWPVGSTVTLVMVAPFTEEFLCRGVFLRGMLNRLRPWTAIVLSAVFFAVMHLNPWQAVSAFTIGLVLGWIYMRTRSVALCVFVHALNNAVALYFMSKMNTVSEADLFWENTWWMNLGGVALLAAGVTWLCLATRKGAPPDEYAASKPPPLPQMSTEPTSN
ncbi:hypothetical protein CKA38_09760 [Ereboglobus luteus]|uniref:CAAX prenyl protease 2/Lysostaphin resistance protein A-like domain-containing protein n=1 Tax=Ereboglobus luteus TaxID=1796921 RepID=A0A2U8E4P3_9BACT|nr:hypothetical protein CKA38_09760 [Ereboglobus luteus]